MIVRLVFTSRYRTGTVHALPQNCAIVPNVGDFVEHYPQKFYKVLGRYFAQEQAYVFCKAEAGDFIGLLKALGDRALIDDRIFNYLGDEFLVREDALQDYENRFSRLTERVDALYDRYSDDTNWRIR